MGERIEIIRPQSDEVSETIKSTSPDIIDVIPRDTMTQAERYIIFTRNGELPDKTRQKIEELPYYVRDMEDHAIDYQHSEHDVKASHMARKYKP